MRYKLIFFSPEPYVERIKQALFDVGAGQYDGYDCCSWQILGEGQYKAKKGSQPFQGNINEIERVSEYRVEMVCDQGNVKLIIETLLLVHPYEVPAYEVWPIMSLKDF